jgi:hypothetical protein
MSSTGVTIALLPPEPAHEPPVAMRALLYPLWILRVTMKLPWGAPREITFSVDGVRGIPLPIREWPETIDQAIPTGCRVLDAVPLEEASATCVHFARKALGAPRGRLARVRVDRSEKVYKLYWIVGDSSAETLIDSRSGARVDLSRPEGTAADPPGRAQQGAEKA